MFRNSRIHRKYWISDPCFKTHIHRKHWVQSEVSKLICSLEVLGFSPIFEISETLGFRPMLHVSNPFIHVKHWVSVLGFVFQDPFIYRKNWVSVPTFKTHIFIENIIFQSCLKFRNSFIQRKRRISVTRLHRTVTR